MKYHDLYTNITWADSSLRKFLNSTFFNDFSEENKKRIISVTNRNLNNHWFDTYGGLDTKDNIFLLSLEEVCKYFGDSTKLLIN